jgi:uncharacterized secreted protein with C-terminal beta-propeller domain
MRHIALFLALIACGKAPQPVQPPADIQQNVALRQATSCGALEGNVHDTAVRQMRMQLDQEKSGNYGGIGIASGGTPAPQAAPAGPPASYTTTNTQVGGVDEADFVKNDGTRIFVLSGRRLFSAKSWPPESLAVAGTLDLEGWPSEMFLDGDQIAVFSSIWTQPASTSIGATARPCALDGWGCFSGSSTT